MKSLENKMTELGIGQWAKEHNIIRLAKENLDLYSMETYLLMDPDVRGVTQFVSEVCFIIFINNEGNSDF
jgi:hypothetical protein